jgi:hypothetical protein
MRSVKQETLIVQGFGGERGIRTPGNFRFNGFQDRRIRPLCHLSGAKIGLQGVSAKYKANKKIFLFEKFNSPDRSI